MSKRIKPLKTMIILSVMLLLGAFGLHSALSGQLDPASAPGPTMYTLEEIYNKLVEHDNKVDPAPVPWEPCENQGDFVLP
jgi:hypothetical protein